ncbi:DUF7577 domain-containing protein [Haloarcula salina]|uniref:Zinc ribbon domain-containing protein n=1 Tax=Haloarcula salina TaxID=1429914 RepID=A0AA41G1F5_9EURY|nr:zinc-ribbon domain-containing protein [Haloarcula salina]MBV0902503.1 zinc ribbon domain-containing protein [Haloarcula salina]
MMVSEWLYGAIALLVGLHVLTMLYAYRHRGDPAGTSASSDGEARRGTATDDDTEAISCPHCGASNELDYQFCRQCVADLTSGSPQNRPTDRSQPY